VNRTLQTHKDQRKGPTILVIGSSLVVSNLMDGIPLIKDFPYKMIPYPQIMSVFGSIGWQLTMCRKMIGLFFTVEPWIRSEIKMSGYADVPLCNTETDWSVAMIDLFLARELTRRDMVLWYSVSERPDLGGRQDDNTQPSNLEDESDHVINNPGSYGNITLDLQIGNLAFNTIIQAAMVNELEGSASIVGFEGGLLNMDATAETAPGEKAVVDVLMTSANYNQLNLTTFSIIRAMIKLWYARLVVPKSQNDSETTTTPPAGFDGIMLDSFYRWLTNPNAKMHEPALLSLIHGLMRKVFFQLVAQFRKLGSEVFSGKF
jgi:DNA polymerase epsilon subunit 1